MADASSATPRSVDARDALPDGVLAVRRGPGANCSSIGSVVDVLFGAAVVGGALYALIAASLREHESPACAPTPVRPAATVGPSSDEEDR